jgi:hypothetical protein
MRTGLCVKFPDHQGRYREFSRFWPSWIPPTPEKALFSLGFLSKFPTQRNREFFPLNRKLSSLIREFSGRSRETSFIGSTAPNRGAFDGNQVLGGTLPSERFSSSSCQPVDTHTAVDKRRLTATG